MLLRLVASDETRPYFGVVYSSVGNTHFQHSILSANTSGAHAVRFNLADDHELATCRNITQRLGHKWECFDVRLTQSYDEHASCVEHARFSHQPGNVRLSHIWKLLAIKDAPFETTLFLDSDAKPCYTLDEILSTVFMRNESMFSIVDMLIGYTETAPDHFKDGEDLPPLVTLDEGNLGRGGYPFGLGEPNGGMMLYRTDRPVVQRMLKYWLARYCETSTSGKDPDDEPDLRGALWHSQRVDGLRVMVMLPVWNMKGWRKYIPISRTCCHSTPTGRYGRVIIDHDCEYSKDDAAWLTQLFPPPQDTPRTNQAKLACPSLLTMISVTLVFS